MDALTVDVAEKQSSCAQVPNGDSATLQRESQTNSKSLMSLGPLDLVAINLACQNTGLPFEMLVKSHWLMPWRPGDCPGGACPQHHGMGMVHNQ